MKIGVLLIGSLYWDAEHRKTWRDKHLEQDAKQYVKQYVRVPIRYGRRSKSRGCSYTMVFSAGLCEKKFGQAIVVPYNNHVNSIENLFEEAEYLWAAERNSCNRNHHISARCGWGCVALLENPIRPIPEELRDGWTKRVSRESCYGQLMNSANGEEVVVDKDGFLKIPWPKSEDGSDLGVDALLATATNPTIVGGCYPLAQQIADAWNTRDGKNYIDYFCKNRAHGIETFQDDEIEGLLRERGQ